MTTPRLLSDRYELGEVLGYGGMAEVHRGRDIRLGRDVAIKVLRADLARDPSFQMRFRREAQTAAALNHPAIVAVYDTGEVHGDSGHCPTSSWSTSRADTLRDVSQDERPDDPAAARMEIIADVCAALDFSHRHGIVHRDIKPANVMINRAGAVKVMDFGIARAARRAARTSRRRPRVIGTAQYLSPEQARGETVDARSRRLLHRLRALRAAHRRAAVHRRLPGRRGLPARAGGPDAAVASQPGRARRSSTPSC